MKPSTVIGGVLLIAGLVILGMRGVGYTKQKNSVEMGPMKVSTEERGFIPPVAGIALVAVGAVVLLLGKRRT